MKRLSSICAVVGSLAMASAFGVACSTSHTRDEDTLGPQLGQSTAQGPSDPNAPTPAPPSTPAPPIEHVPSLSHAPSGPAPVGAPAPTAAETVEPPSPSPTPRDDLGGTTGTSTLPVPVPTPTPAPSPNPPSVPNPPTSPNPAPPAPTPPPANPMPAPTTPPSMMPMGAGLGAGFLGAAEPMQVTRDGGVPIVVPKVDGGVGAPRDAAPAPIRDAAPPVTPRSDAR